MDGVSHMERKKSWLRRLSVMLTDRRRTSAAGNLTAVAAMRWTGDTVCGGGYWCFKSLVLLWLVVPSMQGPSLSLTESSSHSMAEAETSPSSAKSVVTIGNNVQIQNPFDQVSSSPAKSSPASPSTPQEAKTTPRHAQSAPAQPMRLPFDPPVRPQTDQRLAAPHSSRLQQPMPQPNFDDDENTEPSSEANTANISDERRAGSFARFIENTRRRLGTADSDDDRVASESALICGYLQKLGRNGKWQTRWFESDGECLSYYKSDKRNKLLATLDLAKVGDIIIEESDPNGTSFTIQVLGRLYHLRARSRAECKDWVITLNRVKEARLQQGNVKLVHEPVDFLDQQNVDMVTPRVVLVANRQRTRAVDESQEWDRLILMDGSAPDASAAQGFDKRRSTLGTVVLARWTKNRSSLSKIGAKLARWARSLRKYRCTEMDEDSVQLDRHVHPPGHDYKRKNSDPKPMAGGEGLSGWIGKEATQVAADSSKPVSSSGMSPKPAVAMRTFSATSDEEARMIS